MARHQKVDKENNEKKAKKYNKSSRPKTGNSNNGCKNYSFEDPHLDRFFQQNKKIHETLIPIPNRNRNVIVIQDDEDEFNEEDRIDSVSSLSNECTNAYFNFNEEYDDNSSSKSFPSDNKYECERVPLKSTPTGSDSTDLFTNYQFDCDIKFNENDTYRIGNWVFCEFEPNQPYSIRKIEELKKKSDGTIEAKLRCAFRRCDIPASLLGALEKRYSQYFTVSASSLLTSPLPMTTCKGLSGEESTYLPLTKNLNSQEIFQLKQRELFYSKYIEFKSPFDVNCLRGKIELDLLMPDIHASTDYLRFNQNKFFYQINYDSNQKRLSLDQIHIRIGDKFQAELPDFISNKLRKLEVNKETLLWNPKMCQLNNPKLKNYLNKIVEKKTIH